MIPKNFFRFTALTSGFFLIALHSQPLMAQTASDTYFYPVSSWATKYVLVKNSKRTSCIISNEFNNGFFLQISGSKGAVETLSLNLRQPAFEVGQIIDIELSIPGKTKKSFPAKAFEPEILVIDMTGEDKIFTEMQRGGVLDIALGSENEFRFYLTGLGAAIPAYDQCTGNTDTTVAKTETKTQTLPETKAQKTNIKEPDIETKEIDPVAEIKTAALPDAEAQKTNIKKPDTAKTEIDPVLDNKTEIKGEVLDSDELLKEISEFVEPAKSAPKIKNPEPKIEADIKTTKKEPISELPVVTETLQSKPVKMSSPKPDIERENIKAEADFTNFPVPEKNIASVPAQPPIDSQKMRELENKLSMITRENNELNAELEKALRDSEKERLTVSSDNWNLEEATMRYNEADRQIARLGQQVQKERAQCTMEKKELEMMLFDPSVTDQAQLARLSSLEKQLEEAKAALEQQRISYETKISQLQKRPPSQ
jgi:hypothetical protein